MKSDDSKGTKIPLKLHKEGVLDQYQLDKKDRLIIRQLTEYPSTPILELSEMIGVSRSAVRKRMRKPAFKRAFAEITQTTDEALRSLAHVAIQRLRKLLESKDERVGLEACKLILSQQQSRNNVETQPIQEVIYRTRFGSQGQLISEKEEVPSSTPKNTLELLGYT